MGRAKAAHQERGTLYEAVGGRDHRRRSFVDGLDDLGVVDPSEVDRGDGEVGVLDMRVIWQLCQGSRPGLRR